MFGTHFIFHFEISLREFYTVLRVQAIVFILNANLVNKEQLSLKIRWDLTNWI